MSKLYRPKPDPLASIRLKHEDRWLLFPPGHPLHDPPHPSPSPSPPPPSPPRPFIVPHRRSRHHSQSSSELNIVSHPLIPGVYVSNDGDGNTTLYTKSLVPGVPTLDNYEDLVVSVQDKDGTTVEYREWSPYESKLAAAILSGAENIWIKPGSRVLVLSSQDDHQFGITMSHISDIVGPQGVVYVVEASNWKTLVAMTDKRLNILPIIHMRIPCHYRMLINTVDVLFASLDSEEQAHMAELNAMYFLKAGGHYMVYVQANCIDSTSRGTNRGTFRGDALFSFLSKGQQIQFKRMEQVTLEPFDRDHAYVSGVFRTHEVADIDPSCLVSCKFWTSQDSYGVEGRRLTLYEKQKNLPVFMLFESSCGYAIFRAHDVYKVERNYVAIEEYINRFNEFFELIACHTFESTSEALMHLNACNDTLSAKLKEFLVLHLPKPMKGAEHCYTLALSTLLVSDDLVTDYNIACSSSLFHEEIIRGVRINIDKFFRDLKPGDLEKAQLDLAGNYCRQKLISPEKGKSQKRRGAFQASVSTRKKPRKK